MRRPRRRLALVEARVSDGTGEVKATWFNQAWLAEKLQPGTRVRLRGSLGRYGFTVKSLRPERRRRDRRLRARLPRDGGPDAEAAPRARRGRARRSRGEQWDPLPASLRARRAAARRARTRSARCTSRVARRGRERRAAGSPSTSCSCSSSGSPAAGAGARRQVAPALGEPGELVAPLPRRAAVHAHAATRSARSPSSTPTSRGPTPMQRLLQGDVGSGKTVVALYALLRAVETGRQRRADGADRDARRAALPHDRAALPRARGRGACCSTSSRRPRASGARALDAQHRSSARTR